MSHLEKLTTTPSGGNEELIFSSGKKSDATLPKSRKSVGTSNVAVSHQRFIRVAENKIYFINSFHTHTHSHTHTF